MHPCFTVGLGLMGSSHTVAVIRELSCLKLGTGVEEFLEGYQIFWAPFSGVSKILANLPNIEWVVRCLECIQTQIEIAYHLQQMLDLLLLYSSGRKEVT